MRTIVGEYQVQVDAKTLPSVLEISIALGLFGITIRTTLASFDLIPFCGLVNVRLTNDSVSFNRVLVNMSTAVITHQSKLWGVSRIEHENQGKIVGVTMSPRHDNAKWRPICPGQFDLAFVSANAVFEISQLLAPIPR